MQTHHYRKDKEIGQRVVDTATGFFYHNKKSGLLFLITNRHVVKEPHFPNAIKLRLHTNAADMTQNTEYPIHLYRGAKPVWRTPNPAKADVVAIPIDLNDFATHSIRYKSLNAVNLLDKRFRLDIGDDVMVIGYPLGLYDDVHNTPLVMGGTISSPHPIPWRREPFFLVHANLHKGTSGSPVTTKFKTRWRGVDNDDKTYDSGPSLYFLGIISEAYVYREERLKRAGLNKVYFADIIEEMTALGS
jgi:S1-C subfamily serine protease